ncbi:hypothetical protein UCRPC4_g03187 [Phaeomoniella chlamydospora]|uniref:Uncharacterized protein n=1 Tax=Phaeomoniella chlamydospora TaxID=158046 RepID=A0A0G2H1K6_PHACM|nr:hypothetical protein UCRPC4_g03187 [Phaeomoniella chlamydospora]
MLIKHRKVRGGLSDIQQEALIEYCKTLTIFKDYLFQDAWKSVIQYFTNDQFPSVHVDMSDTSFPSHHRTQVKRRSQTRARAKKTASLDQAMDVNVHCPETASSTVGFLKNHNERSMVHIDSANLAQHSLTNCATEDNGQGNGLQSIRSYVLEQSDPSRAMENATHNVTGTQLDDAERRFPSANLALQNPYLPMAGEVNPAPDQYLNSNLRACSSQAGQPSAQVIYDPRAVANYSAQAIYNPRAEAQYSVQAIYDPRPAAQYCAGATYDPFAVAQYSVQCIPPQSVESRTAEMADTARSSF